MPRNDEICYECEFNSLRQLGLGLEYMSLESAWLELLTDTPIIFKDKKHAFKNCSGLALDKELDAAAKTSEWHVCKIFNTNCQRIYDKDEEYCAKHNKQCQYYQCGTREGVNSENYCSSHANECKSLSCKTRTNKEYCSQHTYKCYINERYFHSSSCSQRVAESYSYCVDHYQACKNFHCWERIPYSQSLCNLCTNTDLCLEDCGRRIPKYTTYCSLHREQDQLKDLVKQRTSLPGLIYQVERFKTWWANENVATIITINGNSYWVFLGVIDRKPNSYGRIQDNEIFVFPTNHSEAKWGIYSRKEHTSLSAAQSEASWLKTKLNGDNPILVIHPLANSYTSFNNMIREPYVKKEEIGFSYSEHKFFYVSCNIRTPDNLDNLFKIGDIAWVEKRDIFFGKQYFHVGIYLGKDAICHVSDPNALISEENMKARITGWNVFLKNRTGELYCYHPIIPFKHYKKIIEQVVKAYWEDYGEGKYDLFNDNCEHFANAIVLGMYYSQQVADKNGLSNFIGNLWQNIWTKQHNLFWKIFQPKHWSSAWRDIPIINLVSGRIVKFNNEFGGKDSINLRNEINSWDSNGRFDNLTSTQPSRIKDYQQEYEARIEQPVNIKDCVIM